MSGSRRAIPESGTAQAVKPRALSPCRRWQRWNSYKKRPGSWATSSASIPQGDTAAYDSIVRMARIFAAHPLGRQGNFGSIDGDPPAAMRYTEVRMARIAEELLTDLEKETVDFMPTYDESMQEPTVLPAALPLLLLNGASGIAVGVAPNIPPHNLVRCRRPSPSPRNRRSAWTNCCGSSGPDFPRRIINGGSIYRLPDDAASSAWPGPDRTQRPQRQGEHRERTAHPGQTRRP